MRATTIGVVLASLLVIAAAAATQGLAQDDPLRIAWQIPCMAPASTSPAVLCVPANDSRLSKLESRYYSTFMVSVGSAPEARYQLLASTTETKWRVLVNSPGTTVCDLQLPHTVARCGPVATGFGPDDCEKAAGSDATSASVTCTLRMTPIDNPSFPHFPDPGQDTPGYFAPWPVYGSPGGVPGDLDKLFFENLDNLSPAPTDPSTEPLTPAQRRQLEILAWQEFLAVNWPVNDDDGATRLNATKAPDGNGDCPAWAGWRRRDEVMRGTKNLPIPWGINPGSDGSTQICNGFLPGGLVAMTSATGGPVGSGLGDLGAGVKQPDGHLLYDRNGLLVFYDVRMNRYLYDYILREGLYRKEPPKQAISIPQGQLCPTLDLGLLKANERFEGPIAVKFAWKQLTSCDHQDRFLLARADLAEVQRASIVKDAQGSSCGGAATAQPATKATVPSTTSKAADSKPDSAKCLPLCKGEICLLGLVGMHIGHKTASNPNWNWSTFAHRDALADRDGGPALFGSGDCDDAAKANCNDCKDGRCATRICRASRPAASTQQLNGEIESMLADSKMPLFRAASNYELLGVQWVDQTVIPSRPAPAGLLNPLMETFVTDESPHDCYSCHLHAKPGDFLFFLSRLVPAPTGQQPQATGQKPKAIGQPTGKP